MKKNNRKEGKGQAVYQFKITLLDISPPVWRRIQVPKGYSFWELHVAISDCMPWLDYHLHEFEINNPRTGRKECIGIPSDEDVDTVGHEVLEGGDIPIARYFSSGNPTAVYRYDFGDGWEHEILFEQELAAEPGAVYPRCLDGHRACPPEDVGGTGGYEDFLKIIFNPNHPERKRMLEWAQSLTGKPNFAPEEFEPASVQFDDPVLRWNVAFCGAQMTAGMRCYGGITDKVQR